MKVPPFIDRSVLETKYADSSDEFFWSKPKVASLLLIWGISFFCLAFSNSSLLKVCAGMLCFGASFLFARKGEDKISEEKIEHWMAYHYLPPAKERVEAILIFLFKLINLRDQAKSQPNAGLAKNSQIFRTSGIRTSEVQMHIGNKLMELSIREVGSSPMNDSNYHRAYYSVNLTYGSTSILECSCLADMGLGVGRLDESTSLRSLRLLNGVRVDCARNLVADANAMIKDSKIQSILQLHGVEALASAIQDELSSISPRQEKAVG